MLRPPRSPRYARPWRHALDSRIPDIAARLAAHQPRAHRWARRWRRAAVGVVLRPGPAGPELLLVRRAERDGDPWSGDMALPGGLQDPEDGDDIEQTARRETAEEAAVRGLHPLGRLSDHLAGHPGTRRPLALTPVVFAAPAGAPATPDERETVEALWVPLRDLLSPRRRHRRWRRLGPLALPWPEVRVESPAGDRVVWGLTLRVLDDLAGLLR